MISKKICFAVKGMFLLFMGGIPYVASAKDGGLSIVSSITRIQARNTIDSNNVESYTFSSYMRARNRLFFLVILDYQNDHDLSGRNGRFELNLGRPFSGKPLGWIARGRFYYEEGSAVAAGLQLNFNVLPGVGAFLEKIKARTFLQILHNANDPYFGNFEVLHYYSIDVVRDRVSIRGNNTFYDGGDAGSFHNIWADLIYAVNPRFDFYYRASYVSRSNEYLGHKGATQNLGFRINFF